MKLYSFCFLTLLVLFFLCLLYKPSNCQQTYLNNYQLDCDANPSATRGNYCSGPKNSCQSFTTFRSAEPYNTPISIAYLLGSEASSIASINNISSTDKVPSQKTVIVPISCSCSGSIYQQNAPYTIKKTSETYFTIANDTYQGLTTCQALMDQNKYKDTNLSVGLQLMIPLRCACPSESQAANGVTALLNYMITWGDTISHIANSFGVQEQSILDANMLPPDSLIFPFTPLQIPLKGDSCGAGLFTIRNGSLEFGNCQSDSKKLPVKLVTLLGIGLGLGFLCLFLVGCQFYRYFKKRRDRARKEKLFKQNGGYLLEQRLSFYGTNERAKIFTAEELESATDNYSQSRFLGQGGFGTVYKGMLKDGSIVAVKRSKAIDKGQIEQFINEVVILSQINHRHVVKLLGCCLETEVPVLVYEFISNGTLSKHIHQLDQENESSSLSWEHRVRIACEVAGAVAYMHSAASIPIIHRDIKSSNILLDDKFSAKVSDFGTSRSIPNDKTHLTTQVQGTFGYLDPEYFQSSQFTDKSDVYSFGVVLVELLTGKKPISLARAEEEINLVAYFISSAKENKQPEIIDPTLTKDAEKEDIDAVAELALRCLRLKGKKRPTMKQVSLELEGLRRSQRCVDIYEEPQVLRDETSNLQNAEETGQESIADNSTFALQMESESF